MANRNPYQNRNQAEPRLLSSDAGSNTSTISYSDRRQLIPAGVSNLNPSAPQFVPNVGTSYSDQNVASRTFHGSSYQRRGGRQDYRPWARQNGSWRQRNARRGFRSGPPQRRVVSQHNGGALPEASDFGFIKVPVPQKSLLIADPNISQRDKLTEELNKGTLECLICYDRILQIDPIWCCPECYHVLHLKCTVKWAYTSFADYQWRCPACQFASQAVPYQYRCYCGNEVDPQWERGVSVAHSCGKMCKLRRRKNCTHECPLICHPGACPPCSAIVRRICGCGAECEDVICSSKDQQSCNRTCGKLLNCKLHTCLLICHKNDCPNCDQEITQVCGCINAKETRSPCGDNVSFFWCCGSICNKPLACGNDYHTCQKICHEGPCETCALSPDVVKTCPCGKRLLTKDEERKSCADPIPTCGNVCEKQLSCGGTTGTHICKELCHEGTCPPCPDITTVLCRCKSTSHKIPCIEIGLKGTFCCHKKCNRVMSCGKHFCKERCCPRLWAHRCANFCSRILNCGTHRCESLCHIGHCGPCERISTSGVYCTCGRTYAPPPIPCGTRPPICGFECSLGRICGHSPHHDCHPQTEECPPCLVFTRKLCYGRHEIRLTIPCHQESFSCGNPCGKPSPCGKHTCVQPCHMGPCKPEECTQVCLVARPQCGHPCKAPCHSKTGTECPATTPCRHPVVASCPCGRLKQNKTCEENLRDASKIASMHLANSSSSENGTIELTAQMVNPACNLITLICDEECLVEARSRRFAEALKISNPDLSSKPPPKYTEASKAMAAKDPEFAQNIHDKLVDLVCQAQASKQPARSFSFPSMNRKKRQFVHEMCEQFGCQSQAYDAEPNRNVIATARKDKSWVPTVSVVQTVERESGRRKRVPPPVVIARNSNQGSASPATTGSGWATLSTPAWSARPSTSAAVDYFDNPPE